MLTLLKETWGELRRHDAMMLAGTLAYFGVLALAPLLVVGLAVAGLFLESAAVMDEVRALLARTVGEGAAELVLGIVESMRDPAETRVAAVTGVGVLLYTSHRLFVVLQRTLNRIWDVQLRTDMSKRQRLGTTLRRRALAFLMVLAFGLLLLVLVLGNTALQLVMAYANPYVREWLPPGPYVFVGELMLLIFALVLVTGAIYTVLPDVKLAWRDVMLGAGVTGAGQALSIVVLARYFSLASPASVYGAAGSFVALLLFAYWSAFVFLAGAQLTAVWARSEGRGREAYPNAEVDGRRPRGAAHSPEDEGPAPEQRPAL